MTIIKLNTFFISFVFRTQRYNNSFIIPNTDVNVFLIDVDVRLQGDYYWVDLPIPIGGGSPLPVSPLI